MVTALRDRGTAVCRVNTAWFPAQLSLSAGLRGGRWSGYLRTPAHCVELEDVHAVWYRSPEAYQMPDELSAPERQHAFLEAKYGLGGVLSSLPAFRVNHPARMADAAYKPVQLVRAHKCGLTVPDTIISNEPETGRRFATEGRTVTKLFGSNTISQAHRVWTASGEPEWSRLGMTVTSGDQWVWIDDPQSTGAGGRSRASAPRSPTSRRSPAGSIAAVRSPGLSRHLAKSLAALFVEHVTPGRGHVDEHPLPW